MTKQEYWTRFNAIQKQFEDNKRELARTCAYSNNPYKVGDIIKDDKGSIIQIERIMYSYGYGDDIPFCVYEGKSLKKDLTPRKVKPLREKLFQSRVIAKLN